MIRALALAATWVLLGEAARADNVPGDVPFGVEPELALRALVKREPWLLVAEAQGSWQTDRRAYRSLVLGGYARVQDWLKAGFFYQAQQGARHDEDWLKEGEWHWRDPAGRLESLLVADLSPRLKLEFLPGENWVAEIKTRYAYNFFDGEQTLRLRPGVTYFWLREGQPFLNFFLQHELYLPLNYGSRTVYETWTYLGALYHAAEWLQLGGYAAYKTRFWSSTAAFTAQTGRTYLVEADSLAIGALFVLQL